MSSPTQIVPGRSCSPGDSLSLPPLRDYQLEAIQITARDVWIVSAPQLGKGVTGKCWLLSAMWLGGNLPWPWWWVGPTYVQSRREYLDLCRMAESAGIMGRYTTTAPLEGVLTNGARIEARSWELPGNLQGPTIAGAVLDEWGRLTSDAYAVLSARRSETVIHGYGAFRGYGNVGDVACFAEGLWGTAVAGEPGTAYRRWTWRERAADLDCPCGIEDLDYLRVLEHRGDCQRRRYLAHILGEARRLSRKEFGRMYEAEWEDTTDLPVYTFDRFSHVSKDAEYVPGLPVSLCCDFNVDPLAWTMGQQKGERTWTYDEIEIPGGGTTSHAIEEFKRRHPVRSRVTVKIYGDRSGKSRDTRGLQSDYDIIRDALTGYEVEFYVPAANPAVKNRVNAVNARLLSALGEVRHQFHPRCRLTIRDMARTSWKPGTREIDKLSDRSLTHFSDGVGYWLAVVFPTVAYDESGSSVYVSDAPMVADPIMGLRG